MHCEPRGCEIDLRPAEPDKLGDAQPVAEAHQNRQRIAAAMPTRPPCRFDQPVNLKRRQILAGTAALGIGAATRRRSTSIGREEPRLDCSQNGGWHLFGSIKQAAVSSRSS